MPVESFRVTLAGALMATAIAVVTAVGRRWSIESQRRALARKGLTPDVFPDNQMWLASTKWLVRVFVTLAVVCWIILLGSSVI